MKPIPDEWLSVNVLQKRIINHWTVTSYTPDPVSLDSYHLIVDGNGKVHRGNRDLNERAPHTYMFNSAIGVSMACMGGFQSFANPGKYPPTKAQWDTLVNVNRQLCEHYGIPVSPQTVLMHGEVTNALGVDQWGKWDIGWLPHLGLNSVEACGAELRRLVAKDDLQEVVVRVILANGKSVNGLLMDGTTIVPVRKYCELAGLHMRLDGKQVLIGDHPLDKPAGWRAQVGMVVINGTGYVELRNAAPGGVKVVEWTKTSRVVKVNPTSLG